MAKSRVYTSSQEKSLYSLICLLLLMFSSYSFAADTTETNSSQDQQINSISSSEEQADLYEEASSNYENELSGKLFTLILSGSILAFGLAVLLLEVLVILRSGKGLDAFAFKIISLTLIVIGALYLMSAGYTEKQLTPIIGLLGTVAGYILGQNNSTTS